MNLTIVILFVAGSATLILTFFRSLLRPTPISSARFERVISGKTASKTPPAKSQSVFRNHYNTLGHKEKLFLFLLHPFSELNKSLQILGIHISAKKAVSFFLFIVLLFAYFVFVVFHFNFAFSFFIAFVTLAFVTYICAGVARNKMVAKFQSLFPDALDLIVRSVRAGLPVSEAIKMISAEVPNPVGSAFNEVGSNVTIGVTLDDALDQLAAKIPVAELRFFAISLAVQQETGGNLAEILSNLSQLMRKRVNVKKKIRALSSEARASALIIGSLPFIVGAVIYSFNPSYIEVLFFEDDGRFLIFCALSSITTGAIIMGKLIRFKI
jgi:tight adherence protein B